MSKTRLPFPVGGVPLVMKTKALTIGILMLMLLAGCGNKGSTGTGSSTAFIGGTEGLIITFQEQNPPAEVTDDGFPFFAIIRLENKGEHQVLANEVRVDLEGILPSDFGVAEDEIRGKQPLSTLEPKRRDPNGNMRDGSIESITFPSEDKSFVPKRFTGNVQVNFQANVCYKYATYANGKICVLKDLINRNPKALCDPNTGKASASSSSPIQITGFREAVTGRDKVSFSFDVVHSGAGNIYKVDDGRPAADCPRGTGSLPLENLVLVTVSAEGLNGITCDLSNQGVKGYVRLDAGKRTVTCNVDLTNQHNIDYEKVIDIKAEFNYRDVKDKSVLVKHLV
jgi:hypothetical protein